MKGFDQLLSVTVVKAEAT